ncbi:hypothetical protein QJQ45_003871 [Haematococcus lacustris]|nr:hypothetical protein QJQ45_003871 [Haematococcus lacustris]
MKKKRLSKAHSAHLNALNKSPRAGYLHCPNNIKAAACTAQATNRDLQAEVQRLRDVEQSLMGTVDGLQGDLDDLQAAHQSLQGSGAYLPEQTPPPPLPTHLQAEAAAAGFGATPRLSGGVEAVCRGWLRKAGPSPMARALSQAEHLHSNSRGPVGRPAARTAPYNAHHCLSTVRLHLETGVSRRALSKCRQFFVSEQCVLPNPHRPGKTSTVGREFHIVSTYMRRKTLEAHVQVIMQELLLHGLDSACIASITADSAAVNMGEYGGVVTRMSKLLQSKGQAGCIRAQPCYSHGIHNTLLAGLAALGGDIRPAIESIASLLAQYWVPLGMGAWGAKPQVPCDTRWASYISSTVTMLRVWAHARDAVSQLLERQKGMSPPWAVTLSQLLQDNSLLLRLSVVAVVGESFLVPELMWASKDDGLHAFELYRHTQDVLARLGTWDTLPLLAGLHSQLQHLVPADQREQQKQQLATYLQEHCGAMWTYYQHHVQAQMALPHLFAALGSSDQATRMEVAIDVVYHAELRLPPPEDGQQQQQQQRMQQQQQQEDPYGTWRQYASDIRAMAVNGDPGSPALRLHLEQYYLACPISNAPVESLLQLLKHGGGRYMELPALLQLMSLHTCKEAMKTVDVHDLQQHMGQLRAEVRRKEDATAAAQRSAKAERQITDATHKVGRVVINVGDHACQERLAAAHALALGGHDYGHTTVEEAMKMTGKQLQSYLQFHKQEVHTSWRVPKLLSHVCTHIRGKLAAAAPPQQQLTPAGTTPELAEPAGAPPQQQQQLAAASTSRKRGAPAANKSRAAKQGATHNSVAKRASAARLACGEIA